MVPRSARDSSTVNNGAWVTVRWAMPRPSRNANRSVGVAGMGETGHPEVRGASLRARTSGRRVKLVPCWGYFLARAFDPKSLIHGGEHLIEARENDDFDKPLLAPLRGCLPLQIVGHELPRQCLFQDCVSQ